MLRNLEQAGERTRTLSIIKSRGMKHSNQARELVLSDHGVELAEVFIGPDGGILTGSAREWPRKPPIAPPSRHWKMKRPASRPPCCASARLVEARIAEMQADIAAEADEVGAAIRHAGIGGIRPCNRSRRAGTRT